MFDFAALQVGVTEVVLAVNYKPEEMMKELKELEKKYNVRLTCSLEAEPMGTGASCVQRASSGCRLGHGIAVRRVRQTIEHSRH